MTADPDDIKAMKETKKRKLQSYEQKLKRFEYKNALSSAIDSKNPEVVLSLIEELVQRDGLFIAIANRSEPELIKLIDFIIWKLPDHRYSSVLLEVARITLDVYAGVVGLSEKVDKKLFVDLKSIVDDQNELTKGLLELSGQIDMITRVATLSMMKKESTPSIAQ